MYIIDDSDKSYIVFDKATMEQLAKRIKAMREQMKEQLAKLPPEQRAQMEQLMGGEEGTAYTLDAAPPGGLRDTAPAAGIPDPRVTPAEDTNL